MGQQSGTKLFLHLFRHVFFTYTSVVITRLLWLFHQNKTVLPAFVGVADKNAAEIFC